MYTALFFFLNVLWPATIYTLSLHDALPIYKELGVLNEGIIGNRLLSDFASPRQAGGPPPLGPVFAQLGPALGQSGMVRFERDRKSTRLNSSHTVISYAVFCLKKKMRKISTC